MPIFLWANHHHHNPLFLLSQQPQWGSSSCPPSSTSTAESLTQFVPSLLVLGPRYVFITESENITRVGNEAELSGEIIVYNKLKHTFSDQGFAGLLVSLSTIFVSQPHRGDWRPNILWPIGQSMTERIGCLDWCVLSWLSYCSPPNRPSIKMSSRVKVDRDILGGGRGVTGNHRMLGFVGRVSKLLMFYHYTLSLPQIIQIQY